MNLRQIEILHAVIRCRTTVAAARALGLSQPAVSNAIKALEARAGFPLFERINNRLFPTREARQLYDDAKPIFDHHRAFETRLTDLRENKGGQLRIIATPPMGYGPIPAALRRFVERRPKVRVFFDVRRLEYVLESLETGADDLGFALNLPERPGVARQAVHDGCLVCVFPAGHPLAACAVVQPADLAPYPLIALDADSRLGAALRDAFRQAGRPFDFVVQVRYCVTACELARSGVGVAVVDSLSPACGGRDDLDWRPFEPTVPVVACAAWSAARPLPRLARAFLRELDGVAFGADARSRPAAQAAGADAG